MKRSPQFGAWGDSETWGDTPRHDYRQREQAAERDRGHSERHCPECGALVDWRVNGSDIYPVENGRRHLCDPEVMLPRRDHEDGAELLAALRRALVERGAYG